MLRFHVFMVIPASLPLPAFLAALTMDAKHFIEEIEWLSNSTFVGVVVALFVIFVCRGAVGHLEKVPKGLQNAFEALVGGLYTAVESIVGRHMVAKCFPLLGTLFIFILFSNWFALVPGVGTIGFGTSRGPLLGLERIELPLLRPATADLNMTLAMAAVAFVMWFWWTIRELGVGGLFVHTFGPKGGVKGGLALALMPVFIFVGLIEVVSIAFRPMSLSLRLFGNVFAGENLLHAMLIIGDKLPSPMNYIAAVVFPLPFYFLELLIGLLQAIVFTMLCAVYIQLTTSHDEEESGHGHGDGHAKEHGH